MTTDALTAGMVNRAKQLIDAGHFFAAATVLTAVSELLDVQTSMDLRDVADLLATAPTAGPRTVVVPLLRPPARDEQPRPAAVVPHRESDFPYPMATAPPAEEVDAFRGRRSNCGFFLADPRRLCNLPIELIDTPDGGNWIHSPDDSGFAYAAAMDHQPIPRGWLE